MSSNQAASNILGSAGRSNNDPARDNMKADRLLEVPRPQRPLLPGCSRNALMQQSSGDTGLGSSLELSPTNNTPIPVTQSFLEPSTYSKHQSYYDCDSYELQTFNSQANIIPLVVKIQQPPEEDLISPSSDPDLQMLSNSAGFNPHLYSNFSPFPHNRQLTKYFTIVETPEDQSEENELEHNRTLNREAATFVKLAHQKSIPMPRAPVIDSEPIMTISEQYDKHHDEMSYESSGNRSRRIPRSAGLSEEAAADLSDHQRYQKHQLQPISPHPAQSPKRHSVVNTNSTWWKWSQERRKSLSKRGETDLLDDLGVEDRVPTPIMKAREESLRLGSSADQAVRMMPTQRQTSTQGKKNVGKRKGKKGRKASLTEVELTMSQWNRLIAYWEHRTFVNARYASLVMLLMALIVGCISVSVNTWSYHQFSNSTYAWSGLWSTCFVTNSSCVSNFNSYDGGNWQKAIIGLVLFSLAFSLMGAILAMLGLCISYLPRKMYYYHSAGEIFFVSALATTVAVGIYPYAVQKMLLQSHYFGYGYGLGWATACLLYLSAFTMMMDDLVRESSRPRPIQVLFCCCRKSSPDSSYPQPV